LESFCWSMLTSAVTACVASSAALSRAQSPQPARETRTSRRRPSRSQGSSSEPPARKLGRALKHAW